MSDLPLLTDEALVALVRGGNNDAFAELMRRNATTTRKLATSVLRDVAEAEDAVQDAWSKAWQHVAHFKGESKFSTWFTRIVINQCLMRLRSRRRRPVVQWEDASPENDRPATQFPDDGPDPEALYARGELQALVRREVALMPPLFREPLLLRDFEHLPIETVAARLQVSVPAAKSRLLRARSELRKRIERHTGPHPLEAAR